MNMISGTTQAGETRRRKLTDYVMSSGRIVYYGLTCSLTKSVMGVSTKAGHRAVDLTPSGDSSRFMDCVQPTTPCLAAAYTDSHPSPRLPAIEEVLTTSALLCSAPAALSMSSVSR